MSRFLGFHPSVAGPSGGNMTKQVLLFGAFAAAVLLSMWWLSGIVPVIALNWRLGETPSSGLGRPFLFWLGLLAIALVRDYVVRRRDRNAVRPFAAALEPEIPADKASVMQSSAGLGRFCCHDRRSRARRCFRRASRR